MREPKIPVSKNPSQQKMYNPKMVQKNRSNEDNPATRKIPTRVKLRRPRKRNPKLSRLPRKVKVMNKPRDLTAREEIAEEAESHKVTNKKAKNQIPSKIRRQKTTTNNRTLTSLPEKDAAVETETGREVPGMTKKISSHVSNVSLVNLANQDNQEKTRMNQETQKENPEMKMLIEELVVVEVEEEEMAMVAASEETEMEIVVVAEAVKTVVVEMVKTVVAEMANTVAIEVVTAATMLPEAAETITKTEVTSE